WVPLASGRSPKAIGPVAATRPDHTQRIINLPAQFHFELPVILSTSLLNSTTSTGHSGQLCSQHTIKSHSDHSCPCSRKFLLWNSNSIHTSCNLPGSTSFSARQSGNAD